MQTKTYYINTNRSTDAQNREEKEQIIIIIMHFMYMLDANQAPFFPFKLV